MGRHCTICTSDHRKAIDLALLFHATSYSRIATHFGVDETSLRRHERAHLAMSWELSKGLRAMLSSDNLLEQLGKWHERMENQYNNADARGNIMAALLGTTYETVTGCH